MIPLPSLAPVYRVVIVGLLLAVGVQQVALYGARATRDKAVAERATAVQERGRLTEAAKGSENTITQLRAANKALVDALAAQQAALDKAADDLVRLRDVALEAGRLLRELERADRAKPQCQLVLNTVLDDPCPALADGVRQRANRRLPGPPGGEAGSGSG